MKKVLGLIFVIVLCVGVLVGCGSNEVDSRDEANATLLSASSVIAECEKTMDDYETRLNTIETKDLDAIKKRLDGCYADIVACDMYKEVEDVKPKYDSTMDKYERALKHLDLIRKQLAKLEAKMEDKK